jgi:FixJ family two-component response regulator
MKTPFSFLRDAPSDSLVCVVDDDELTRRSLRRLFSSVGIAVKTFPSADEYLKLDHRHGPSCLVVDAQVPGGDEINFQQRLADRGEQIIFLSGNADVRQCARAMKAGAVDYFTKPVNEGDLLAGVSLALAQSVHSRKAAECLKSARERLESLTPREREVMEHVIAGLLNKQIAVKLSAAEKTIKIHRGRVMAKMGVSSVAELVRLAQSVGVAPANVAE